MPHLLHTHPLSISQHHSVSADVDAVCKFHEIKLARPPSITKSMEPQTQCWKTEIWTLLSILNLKILNFNIFEEHYKIYIFGTSWFRKHSRWYYYCQWVFEYPLHSTIWDTVHPHTLLRLLVLELLSILVSKNVSYVLSTSSQFSPKWRRLEVREMSLSPSFPSY